MKFLNKINQRYIISLGALLLVVSIVGFFVLKNIILDEMKEDILEKEYAIIKEIKTQNNTPSIYPIIETKEITESEIQKKSYKKITLVDESEGEKEPFIEYTNSMKINKHWYLIKIRHSLLETDDLLIAIALPLLLLISLALLVLFWSTKTINKTIWRDFEFNLSEIKKFSFAKSDSISLKQTNILEFDSLNTIIEEMTNKLQNDYRLLKEFTENASHELQTPIAIISANLEEVLQNDLSESAFKQIVATQNAVKRLSNLNKNLLLLSKISNQQYPVKQELVFNYLVKEKLDELNPLIQNKNIEVTFEEKDKLKVSINPFLADILLNNLLSNAINHNVENGKIVIKISKSQLQISNTGNDNSLSNDNIFDRFTKENSKSYGLGLSIVKKICDTHNIKIYYSKSTMHNFILDFQ
jgi:signal transduction histidine kinase